MRSKLVSPPFTSFINKYLCRLFFFFLILFIVFFTLFLLSQSDSEYMAGQLSAFGYSLSDSPEEADLWLINT